MRAKGLLAADRAKKGMSGTSDPYVVVHSTNGARAKTSVKQATINPEWDETLEINVYDAEVPLLLELWDHDLVGLNDSLGHCEARPASTNLNPNHNPRVSRASRAARAACG